jgi:ankyrin repeat protein
LLLGRGTNINARDGQGRGALIYASQAGHPDVIQLLLGRGADINARKGEDASLSSTPQREAIYKQAGSWLTQVLMSMLSVYPLNYMPHQSQGYFLNHLPSYHRAD